MSDTKHTQAEIDAFRNTVLYGDAFPAPDPLHDDFVPLLIAFIAGLGCGAGGVALYLAFGT